MAPSNSSKASTKGNTKSNTRKRNAGRLVAQSSLTSYFSTSGSSGARNQKGKKRERSSSSGIDNEDDTIPDTAGAGGNSSGKRKKQTSVVDLTWIEDTQVEDLKPSELFFAHILDPLGEINPGLSRDKDMNTVSHSVTSDAHTPIAQNRIFPFTPHPPSSGTTLFPTPSTIAATSKELFQPPRRPRNNAAIFLPSTVANIPPFDNSSQIIPSSQTSSFSSPEKRTPSRKRLVFDPTSSRVKNSPLTIAGSDQSGHSRTIGDDPDEIVPDSTHSSPTRVRQTDQLMMEPTIIDFQTRQSRPIFMTPTKPTRHRPGSDDDVVVPSSYTSVLSTSSEIIPSSQSQYLSPPPKGWTHAHLPSASDNCTPSRPRTRQRENSNKIMSDSVLSETQEESYAPWMKHLLGLHVEGGEVDEELNEGDTTVVAPGMGRVQLLDTKITSSSPARASFPISQTQEESYAPWMKVLMEDPNRQTVPAKGTHTRPETRLGGFDGDSDSVDDDVDVTIIEIGSRGGMASSSRKPDYANKPIPSDEKPSSPHGFSRVFSFDPGNIEPSQYKMPAPVESYQGPTESFFERMLEEELDNALSLSEKGVEGKS